MANRSKKIYLTSLILGCLFLFSIMGGCAKMASIEGGPYDVVPPVLIRAVPQQGATGVTTRHLRLYFDENVKVEKQSEKVIVSPPQIVPPKIVSMGKYINITLVDSLRPNTTYTIDFSDAIVDNNEGNALGGLIYAFSTGTEIDTMQMSGYVLDARTLLPAYNVLVGIYPSSKDSLAFTTQPMMRMTRSLEDGYFVLKNVHNGDYRVVALDDLDRTYSYTTPQERFAYTSQSYTTGVEWVTTPTSEKREQATDSTTTDTPIQKELQYTPNHLLLLLSGAQKPALRLNKVERTDSLQVQLLFNTAVEKPPHIEITAPNSSEQLQVFPQLSLDRKTILYYLPPQPSIVADSLPTKVSYNSTDSTGVEILLRENLTLHKPRTISTGAVTSTPKPRSGTNSEIKNAETDQQKSSEPTLLSITSTEGINKGTTRDTLSFHFVEPILKIDTSRITFVRMQDSVAYPTPFTIERDSLHSCDRQIHFTKKLGEEYVLKIDSAAITGLYGHTNTSAQEYRLKLSSEKDLGSLTLSLEGIQTQAPIWVELLDGTDKVLLCSPADSLQVQFTELSPGTYFARLFVDENHNGVWDGGKYPTRQPEPVYYFPKGLGVQVKFFTQEKWNVTALPLYQQRPQEIKSDSSSSPRDRAKKPREQRNLNEEYIKRMRERYGNHWNPTDSERKILNLPSRKEEAEQKLKEEHPEQHSPQEQGAAQPRHGSAPIQ